MQPNPTPPGRIQHHQWQAPGPHGFGPHGFGPHGAPTRRPVPMAGAWSAGKSIRRTLLVVLIGLAAAGLNTAIAYATLGSKVIPIITGIVLCLGFVIAVRLLHRAAWLSFLALLPALFVLVGSVELTPDLALEERGVRQQVTIVDARTDGKRHTYTLRGADGPLDEPLTYQGDNSGYRVGTTLTVLSDPEGRIALQDATRVDSTTMRVTLLLGTGTWTVIALLAGWRGHVRRRLGRHDDLVI